MMPNHARNRDVQVKLLLALLLLPAVLCSCTYLKYTALQADYARIQKSEPGQVNLKHMIDRELFYVIGRTIDEDERYANLPMAIAAYSNKFKANERVDTMFFRGVGTHYGLSLPDGDYRLVVFADLDGNKQFDHIEVVGERELSLHGNLEVVKVRAQINVTLSKPKTIEWIESIEAPSEVVSQDSLFYPAGTIRSLDDPIFDERLATLGMYDPASFLEKAPTMFYALEEDAAYKIPVVFVHGIDGTPRSFGPLIESLDRERFKPWFFFYPSGGDLNHLADFFYNLFLSGKVISMAEVPMIVVAHSMGGLVVREALNSYKGLASENRVELLFTIASPLGGHAAAKSGEEHGLLVLPAWRDLNPENQFIRELYRKPLPSNLDHELIYAYNNSKMLKFGENSDGVVALSSQLHPIAQQQSDRQFGFNSTHTGILSNEKMIEYVHEAMNGVESIYPQSHLDLIAKGGYEPDSENSYSALTQFFIRTLGHYLVAMANGEIEPVNSAQIHFLQVLKGQLESSSTEETELLVWMHNTGRIR